MHWFLPHINAINETHLCNCGQDQTVQLYLCHGLVGEWLHFNRRSNAHRRSAYLRIDNYNYILACHASECISIDEVCNLLIFRPVRDLQLHVATDLHCNWPH